MVRRARAVGAPATQPSPAASKRKADAASYTDEAYHPMPSQPPEILELIFDNVESRATLYSLCRASKGFYHSALPRLYSQIAVSAIYFNNVPGLIRTLEPLLSIMQRKKLRTEGQHAGQSIVYPLGLDEDEVPPCARYVREFIVGVCNPGRKDKCIIQRYVEEALKNMPNLEIVQITSVLTASIARSIASLQNIQALSICSNGDDPLQPLRQLRNLRHLSVTENFTQDGGSEPWQTIIANSASTLQTLEQCTRIYDMDSIIGTGCDEQGRYAPPLVKLDYLKISGPWVEERRVDSVLKSINFLNLQKLTLDHGIQSDGAPVPVLIPRLTNIFEAAMATTTQPIMLTDLSVKIDRLDEIEPWARFIASFTSLKRLEILNYGPDDHYHHYAPDLSPELLRAICKHRNISQCFFRRDWTERWRRPKFSPGTVGVLVDSLPLLQELEFYVGEKDMTNAMSSITRAKNLTSLQLHPIFDDNDDRHRHSEEIPPKPLPGLLSDLVEVVFREAASRLQPGQRFVWEQCSSLRHIALGRYKRWELASNLSTRRTAKEHRKKLVAKADYGCECEVWARNATTPKCYVLYTKPTRDLGYNPDSDWAKAARKSLNKAWGQ